MMKIKLFQIYKEHQAKTRYFDELEQNFIVVKIYEVDREKFQLLPIILYSFKIF